MKSQAKKNECPTSIDSKLILGTVQSVPNTSTNQYGMITDGAIIYSYYNHNGVYNSLQVGDRLYFFSCRREIITSLPTPNGNPTELLAFLLHNLGDNANPIAKHSVIKGTTNIPSHNGDDNDTTNTDLPPLLSAATNRYYTINDCGAIQLIENYPHMNTWDRIRTQVKGNISGLSLIEKIGDSEFEWL